LARHAPHLVLHLGHVAMEKGGPKYYEVKDAVKDKVKERRRAQLKDKLKERRQVQQEQSMGEHLFTFTKEQAKFAEIEKAFDELEKELEKSNSMPPTIPRLPTKKAFDELEKELKKGSPKPPTKKTFEQLGKKQPHASDDARQLAASLGADLSQVEGSGPGGLITSADVLDVFLGRYGTSSRPHSPECVE
jgi:pyruvate/2-oxoglutarate dehydrogenase complex dihydrolipoamide acyltransferase (E2) component